MNPNFISRLAAAGLLGGLFGWHIHNDFVKWNLKGRGAYLAYHTLWFDRHMADPRPAAYSIVGTAILAVCVCVLYEALAYAFAAVIKRSVPPATPDRP